MSTKTTTSHPTRRVDGRKKTTTPRRVDGRKKAKTPHPTPRRVDGHKKAESFSLFKEIPKDKNDIQKLDEKINRIAEKIDRGDRLTSRSTPRRAYGYNDHAPRYREYGRPGRDYAPKRNYNYHPYSSSQPIKPTEQTIPLKQVEEFLSEIYF